MEGWISLYRRFIDWQWYRDINTKTLFLHLLLKANHKDQKWLDITIRRGQFVTSYKNLANETGLSIQNVRTSLNRLKSTQEIQYKTTNKYTLISIDKYDFYQDKDKNSTQ